MENILIRKYEPEDFESVLNFDGTPSKRREQKLKMLELKDIFCGYVAESSKEIVGFIIMQDMGDNKSQQVMQINVKEKRKGIGRSLMAETFSKLGNGKHIILAVRIENTEAIKFYEAMGFKKSGHTEGYKKDKDYFWYSIDT